MTTHTTTVRQSGARVTLVLDGAWLGDLPWQAALELAEALRTQAKRAEEWEKASQIAADQAVLLRAGIPIGLTSHPVIQAEAAKIAAWDRDLRRYLPGGVRSQSVVGAPSIHQSARSCTP